MQSLKLPKTDALSLLLTEDDLYLVDPDNIPLCQKDLKKLKNRQKAKQDYTPEQIEKFKEAKLKAEQRKQKKKAKKKG